KGPAAANTQFNGASAWKEAPAGKPTGSSGAGMRVHDFNRCFGELAGYGILKRISKQRCVIRITVLHIC
ncbi:MAG: hypothetical protein KDJ64_10680, partial [Nitratireductor sp.]|nr:hypothetical protein [Nitratireductor sp.]